MRKLVAVAILLAITQFASTDTLQRRLGFFSRRTGERPA
jgi:hypothetical protein